MWNPFKRGEKTLGNPVVAAATLLEGAPRLMLLGSSRTDDQLPQNDELCTVWQAARRDLRGDWRPLWRALLQSELWVPVFDADLETADNRGVHALIFEGETAFYAFTSAQHVRTFFENAMPVEGDTLNVALVDGQMLCDMAAKFEVQRLRLNPNFEDELEIAPLGFRILARGALPAGMGSATPTDVIPTKPIAGLPSPAATRALRETLAQGGASAAYWFLNWREAEGEMHFALGVEGAAEQFFELAGQLAQTWIEVAPFPSPLFVYRLCDDAGQSAFIRERCEPIYP